MDAHEVVTWLIGLIILLTAWNWARKGASSLVRSGVDGTVYMVLNRPDKRQAADTLARLKARLNSFVSLLARSHRGEERVLRLRKKFRAVLSENEPGSKFTSYTLNKGAKIYMCIREREVGSERLIDENTLFFVALHELAHVMTLSVGHTEEFWDNFKFLLQEAIKHKFYKYKAYHIEPQRYCGTMIANTPLKN